MSSWSTNKAQGAAPVNAAVTTAQIFPTALSVNRGDNPLSPTVIAVADSGTLDGKVFLVRASGVATSVGATTTGLIALYAALVMPVGALAMAVANYTLLATSTARVINTTSCPFSIEAELIMDSTSGKLHGSTTAYVNNSIDNKSALSGVLTGIQVASAGGACLYIVAAFTFGVNAAAGNVAKLLDFVLDA